MQSTFLTTVNRTAAITSKPVSLYCAVMKFSLRIYLLILGRLTQGQHTTKQAVFQREKQKYLANHVIESTQAEDELTCALYCVRHDSCASVNYKISGARKGLCELNNEAVQKTTCNDERTNPEFVYPYIFKKVRKNWLHSFF